MESVQSSSSSSSSSTSSRISKDVRARGDEVDSAQKILPTTAACRSSSPSSTRPKGADSEKRSRSPVQRVSGKSKDDEKQRVGESTGTQSVGATQPDKIAPLSDNSASQPLTSKDSFKHTRLSPVREPVPLAQSDTTPSTKEDNVQLRHPHMKQHIARHSWRQTPLIDPDAIEALLKGEVSEEDLGGVVRSSNSQTKQLEPCQEESPPMRRRAQLITANTPRPTFQPPRSNLDEVSPEGSSRMLSNALTSGDKKDRFSTPTRKQDDMKREDVRVGSPLRKRVMIVSTPRNNRAGSAELLSPEQLLVRSENKQLRHSRISNLQSSLTHSLSTPDLSAILSSSKSKSAKRSTRNEESYVTGSSSSTGSNTLRSPAPSSRSSVRSIGTSLVRSFTISGPRGSRRSPKFSPKHTSKLY